MQLAWQVLPCCKKLGWVREPQAPAREPIAASHLQALAAHVRFEPAQPRDDRRGRAAHGHGEGAARGARGGRRGAELLLAEPEDEVDVARERSGEPSQRARRVAPLPALEAVQDDDDRPHLRGAGGGGVRGGESRFGRVRLVRGEGRGVST
jgi:hypothetical protein